MITKPHNPLLPIGTVAFILGAALSFSLLFVSAWGDFKARSFDSALGSEQPLSSLRCPVLLTPSNPGLVTARIENPTNIERTVTVRARFTVGQPYLIGEDRQVFSIKAGEVVPLEWEVFADPAAIDRIVLVRVYQFGSFSIPSRTKSCGIIVSNLPFFTGAQLFYGALTSGIGFMAVGIFLRAKQNLKPDPRTRRITTGMLILGSLLIVGIAVNVIGSWWVSSAFVFLAVITTAGLIVYISGSD
jgi:hypothetical protein